MDTLTGYSEEDETWNEWATQIVLDGEQLVVTIQIAYGTDESYEVDFEIYRFDPSDDEIPPERWHDTPCEN